MVALDQGVQIRLLLTESAVHRKSHPGNFRSQTAKLCNGSHEEEELIKIDETLGMVKGGKRRQLQVKKVK